MIELVYLIIGLIVGLIIGILYSKVKKEKIREEKGDSGELMQLATQLTEIKTKFEELEKRKEDHESMREQRYIEFMNNIHKRLEEILQSSKKSDKEKEKRIEELKDEFEKSFKIYKESTEEFFKQQGESKEEIEKKRDAELKDMRNTINKFISTISGTKTRGNTGEEILKEVLSNSIRTGVVATNLDTETGPVEFAWNLEDGKYIPIDSKLPDIFNLVEQYNRSEDQENGKFFKKQIINSIKNK